jgi:uncharacterized membrane protein YsdA (DUF1294 family)/cold shock CspA family protein
MRLKGKITSWNDQKGYGFITPLDGGKRIFIHIKDFKNRSHRPEEGMIATYSLSTDKQGRPCAADATMTGDRPILKPDSNISLFQLIIATVFLLAIGLVVIVLKIRFEVFILYLATSLFAFLFYALDKSAAKKDNWRTPESTLHLLSLIGGWPGAIFAQQTLRHKTKKQPFRSIFWLTVFLNCGVFLWLLTPAGRQFLDTII